VGQFNLTLEICRDTPIPLPPRDEQVQINQLIAFEHSRLAVITESLVCGRQHSRALRQSVLKHAFSGALVQQDPADEPAYVLLERIAAERGTTSTATTKRSRKLKQPA